MELLAALAPECDRRLLQRAFYLTQSVEDIMRDGRLGAVRYLCLNGGYNPMLTYLAARHGQLEIVEYLCRTHEFDERQGKAIEVAAAHGHKDVVDVLFDFASEDNLNRAMYHAGVSGHLEVIHLLLQNHVDGIHAYSGAAFSGRLNVLVFFRRFNVCLAPFDYDVALQAVKQGNIKVLHYYIAQGVNVHHNGEELLLTAVRCPNVNIVRFLHEAGADVHVYHDRPMLLAAWSCQIEVMEYLRCKGGVPLTEQLIMPAARCVKLLQYVHQHGVNIHFADYVRNYAITWDRTDILEFLRTIE